MKPINELSKGEYSKRLLLLVIGLNIIFSAGVFVAVSLGAAEPQTLINRWFDWTTAEIYVGGGIKVFKIGKDALSQILEIIKSRKENKEE